MTPARSLRTVNRSASLERAGGAELFQTAGLVRANPTAHRNDVYGQARRAELERASYEVADNGTQRVATTASQSTHTRYRRPSRRRKQCFISGPKCPINVSVTAP